MGGKYAEGSGDLWAVKEEIPADRLLILVKFTPLHFALNALFHGTDRAEFEMYVTSLSSFHPLKNTSPGHRPTLVNPPPLPPHNPLPLSLSPQHSTPTPLSFFQCPPHPRHRIPWCRRFSFNLLRPRCPPLAWLNQIPPPIDMSLSVPLGG